MMPVAVDDLLNTPVRRGIDSRKTGYGFMLGIQVVLVLACVGYIFVELALALSMEESSSGAVSTPEEPVSLRVPVRLDLDSTVKSIGDDLRLGNSESKQQKGPCGEAAPSNAASKAITVFIAGALLNCKWARHVIAAGAL